MDIFLGQNLLEFSERFKTDLNCKEYLGEIKWKEDYVCRNCENTTYQIRKNFSRTCNKCIDTESPTANTIDGKTKRMYAMKIHDFSAKSLQYMFVN